jgi:outer membrane immunogenic protein
MKKLLLTSVSAVALGVGGSAYAADLHAPVLKAPPMPAPVFSWTGCHVGGHVGWGWGKTHIDQSHTNVPNFSTSSNSTFHNAAASTGLDSSGAIFGGQVGCDYQFSGNWVIGIGASFSATDINGTASDKAMDNALEAEVSNNDNTLKVKNDWLATVTGRLGYAGWLPDTLVYVRGGAAWMHAKYDFTRAADEVASEGPNSGLFETTHLGWTLGGGWEWRFAQNWTAFVEYTHYWFNSKTLISAVIVPDSGPNQVYNMNVKPSLDTVKVGVNWRFGGH